MPIKWKPLQLIESTAPTPPVPPVTFTLIATTTLAKPRETTYSPRETSAAAPLRDDVMLTPGGHRKHTLTRTSPGGTTRTAQYISPRKGDSAWIHGSEWTMEDEDDLEMEQYGRRLEAIYAVPCQQSAAQRSALARSKRKAGVPAAPQAKRGERKPWGANKKHRVALGLSSCYSKCGVFPCGACKDCRCEQGLLSWEPLVSI
jgi:hypothetical protein